MTPQEAFDKCRAEVVRDREYTLLEAGPLVGLHPGHLRRYVPDRLAARLVKSSRGHQWLVCGARLIFFAGWRASLVRPHSGVLVTAETQNKKLGHAAATYVAKQSCPDTCAFKSNGCYAEHTATRAHWDRITAGSLDKTPLDLARAEAAAIDALPADRDLRLHVAGDSATEEGTRLIADACGRYVVRSKFWHLERPVKVWAYTHAWREVPRAAWGVISVLASCETPADVEAARARGYAAALVVPRFDADATYRVGEQKLVPCPQQTRDKVCTDCRLCFDDTRLQKAGLAIGFALHGGGTNKARGALARRALPMAELRRAA